MKLLDTLTNIIAIITAIILLILVALVVYDASLRYLFSEGSTALQELQWHFFDVVILLSIAYTLKHNAHVRVDIFYDHFSEKKKLLVNMISHIFFILPFAFLIVYISLGFVEMSFMQHESSSDPGGLGQRWIVKALIPFSFILLSLQSFKELIEDFRVWRRL